MCGIVGYIGSKEAYPVLIKGLHRLEYRGYDSSGVAMISDEGKLNIYKAKGKVAALEHFAESKDRSGTVGIAHTRWATHGEPNDTNAHPHASQSGDLAIVHNGTIENYTVVKKALEQHGYHVRQFEASNERQWELLKNNDYTEYYDENIRFHGIFLSLSENILLEQTLIPLRRRLYDFPRRQYSYEWESMNLNTHQRFIDSVKLGNREAAVSIFRIEHWSYEVHKKYFKLYYDFDQKK